MFSSFTKPIAASALLLLSLAACSGAGNSSTSCISGKTWILDLPDLAAQLGEQLSSHGLNVTQSEGVGRQDFVFDGSGTVASHIDVTYTISVQKDDLTITLVQTQGGDTSGEWSWQGDTTDVVFSNWDNAGYSVQNQFLVNGVAGENSVTIPTETLGDGTVMATTCTGTTLSTQVSGSPFTQHWTSEG
ncbi:MAG: hypothetical protein KF761_14895 [Salinibacterium sp.]|nr:hypothetical protein [Salinibacterium sp.]